MRKCQSNFCIAILGMVISITSINAQDILEPNNDINTATIISCGDLTTAFIQSVADKDWYQVQVNQTGTVSASITNAPNNLDLNLEWYQLNGNIPELVAIDDDPNAGGGQMVTATAVIPAGVYYLSIEEEDNNTANTSSSYSFVITCLASPFELNQTLLEAAIIPADTCLEDRIWGNNQFYFNSTNGADDQDWYAVTVSQSGYLKGELIVPASIDMNLELFSDGTTLPYLVTDDGDISAGPGQDLFLQAYVDAGTYYFHLEDEQNNTTSEEVYQFCTSFEPSMFEVNQTIDIAIPIPADTCFEEKILGENLEFFNSTDGANDQDWFVITLLESGYLSADLIVPGAIDMNMELYRQDGFNEILLTDDGDPTAGSGQDLSMVAYLGFGTYYLHLEDEQNNLTLDEVYQICLEFLPSEFEINQTIDSASLIPADTCFQERIWGENNDFQTSTDGNNDQDWYEFNITDSCELLIEIQNVPSTMDLNAEIVKLSGFQQTVIAEDNFPNASNGQSLEIQSILPAGTYYLHIEDEDNNDLSEELFDVCISCTRFTNDVNVLTHSISISPNPVSDIINIIGFEHGWYKVIDYTGREIKKGEMQKKIELSDLQAGIYILILTTEENSLSRIFLKE